MSNRSEYFLYMIFNAGIPLLFYFFGSMSDQEIMWLFTSLMLCSIFLKVIEINNKL